MPKNTKHREERTGMVKKTCVCVKRLCKTCDRQIVFHKKRSHLLLKREGKRVRRKEEKIIQRKRGEREQRVLLKRGKIGSH